MKIYTRFLFLNLLLILSFPVSVHADWPTYQGNTSHTGYVPIEMDTTKFEMIWQKQISNDEQPLNPIAVGDGKVFASLYGYFDSEGLVTLDAETGEILWSKQFGDVFSVNPPAYDNGKIYIQTGNHSDDTYLRAYNADDGTLIFQANHAAQWERYYAPTIYDGIVYIDGGYYGGMYAFDGSNGARKWFTDLNQYDEWTPAVDEKYAYAYLGEYSPALYVLDKKTGLLAFSIPDPNFDWNGWSMDLAPVLGGAEDVIAIHNKRLIRFDLAARKIAWQLTRNFAGQPAVAGSVIYAIDSGALTAWDQLTGVLLWSWGAVDKLSGAVIASKSHVLATSANKTYAINLATHQKEWEYPKSGHLALTDDALYIAAADGELTAIRIGPPPDDDSDGIPNGADNCPSLSNPDQQDADADGIGDYCNDDIDDDGDEWANNIDNCPQHSNPLQENADHDSFGDVCDPYPRDADNLGACLAAVDGYKMSLNDADNDGLINMYDQCPGTNGGVVNTSGCSIQQFCATIPEKNTCNKAVWRNDSTSKGGDCKWSANSCSAR
jgi:outer membrane protein assembly factor BamB